MELAELLQWLSGAQKTGTLVVENGRVTKQIFFRDGMIVSSASTDPKEHLGAFLVSHGFITDADTGLIEWSNPDISLVLVTSPTGIREIDKQCGTDIAELLLNAIAKRLPARA